MNASLDWPQPRYAEGELAAHGVHLERGGRGVLHNVNLCAKPGRVLVLAGPNGAGKSSLLAAFAGLLAPSIGKITLGGRPLSNWPSVELARRRAMLSQKQQLGFPFRVDEVVLLGRSPHADRRSGAEDRRIVEAALRAMHAWDLRSRRYPQLSGGEQQRVQLARVLAQLWDADPSQAWLLLDEPEAGLDIAHQHFVLRHAQAMARRGYGVIAVLHDLNLAMQYAGDVALLVQGRAVRHGVAADALDPQLLSRVYGLPMHRVAARHGWILAPD